MAVWEQASPWSGGERSCPKEDMLATTPPSPRYLAHSTPHGFSLPRVRNGVASPYPRLSANKHPKMPDRTVRFAPPLLQQCIPLPRAGGRENTCQEGSVQSPGKLSSLTSGRLFRQVSAAALMGEGERGEWLVPGRGG